MTYAELKQACELAGLTDADQIWFIDLHPTPEQALVELTKHDTLGYAVTNVPVLLPIHVMADTVPHHAGLEMGTTHSPRYQPGLGIGDAPLQTSGLQLGSTVPVSTPVVDPPKPSAPATPKASTATTPDKDKLPKA